MHFTVRLLGSGEIQFSHKIERVAHLACEWLPYWTQDDVYVVAPGGKVEMKPELREHVELYVDERLVTESVVRLERYSRIFIRHDFLYFSFGVQPIRGFFSVSPGTVAGVIEGARGPRFRRIPFWKRVLGPKPSVDSIELFPEFHRTPAIARLAEDPEEKI